ncbi:sugar transferase [Bacillus cereus]|uniref:sugar transferase n=1 Tax=Bacillus cereus TaxID=1396 RepID=UPI00203AFE2C|nr:sugar transferase [Bacillus cereus]MCM3222905.1 sugar transferase [Bacillus cereus]MEC3336048.1 sugar transferase [Bacillus cereus]
MKRLFDFVVCSLLCTVMVVPFVIIALLVKIKLGSPIIFKQKRPGLYCKPFYIYKFRTMTDKVDRNGKLMPDDERLTKFGKFLRKYSLDEIPQLINVLKGDISLVGPRPLLMEYIPLYTKEQARRHTVRPGITGWAQVNGRNSITWEDKFKFDIWYVDNRSFWVDIKILFLTLKKVIRPEGISQQGHVTMQKFTVLNSNKEGLK